MADAMKCCFVPTISTNQVWRCEHGLYYFYGDKGWRPMTTEFFHTAITGPFMRLGWNGEKYPVLPLPTAEDIRSHMTEMHAYVELRAGRDGAPDTRSPEELVMRHNRMHLTAKQGLVDAHFHFPIQSGDVAEAKGEFQIESGAPLPPLSPFAWPIGPDGMVRRLGSRLLDNMTVDVSAVAEDHLAFEERASESITEKYERLSKEWTAFLAEVEKGYSEHIKREGILFRKVLIDIFGDERQYHTDPEFHANVALAVQMLKQIERAFEVGEEAMDPREPGRG